MGRYGFLLSRRWLVLALILLAAAVACGFLSRWQWHRYQWRSHQIELIEENYSTPPVPLADLLPANGDPLPSSLDWRQVEVEGRYLPEETVLVRNRVLDGSTGYYELVPFLVNDDDMVLWVNRGWLPAETDLSRADGRFTNLPTPTPDPASIVVHLRPAEVPDGRSAPPGQVQTMSLDTLSTASGQTYDSYGAIGVLASEQPEAASSPQRLPAPDLDPGSHLSYTFQWIVFGVIAVSALVILARREQAARDGHPVSQRNPRRRVSAEDEEDAIIDAALNDR